MSRTLDLAPLARSPRLRDRWQVLSADNRMVIAMVVVALLIVVPVAIAVPMALAGTLFDDGGVVACLLLVLGCGVAGVVSTAWQGGQAAALVALARVNDLETVEPGFAPHYRGSVFARESRVVLLGVRTRERTFVEVGERLLAGVPQQYPHTNAAEVYLRARLSGPVRETWSQDELLTPDLREELEEWAGATYAVEVEHDELTVLGSRSLRPRQEGRVRDGLDLVERLVTRAEEVLVTRQVAATAPPATTSGIPVPDLGTPRASPGRPPRPLAVVVGFLALMVVVPVLVALPLSLLDDMGPTARWWLGPLAVGFALMAIFAAVGGFARWAMRRR